MVKIKDFHFHLDHYARFCKPLEKWYIRISSSFTIFLAFVWFLTGEMHVQHVS